MNGVSGVIGGLVLLVIMTMSLALIMMSMTYNDQEQMVLSSNAVNQLTEPHVAQINSSAVMASGDVNASYIIYPNGQVQRIGQPVNGIRSFQAYLNGNPWAVVVFSNGQWINVTSQGVVPPGVGDLGEMQGVPFYPNYIYPWNLSQLHTFMTHGYVLNTPIYSKINDTEVYMNSVCNFTLNPTDPVVYGMGRILSVPVESSQGWLNFTMTYTLPTEYAEWPLGFALIVQNSSNIEEIVYFEININTSNNYQEYTGNLVENIWYNVTYGIYQYYWELPPSFQTYYNNPNFLSFTPLYNESGIDNTTDDLGTSALDWFMWICYNHPVFKVAIKFTPGEPARVYLWYLTYNGTGLAWEKLYLPSLNGTAVHTISIYGWSFKDWGSLTQQKAWPVNIYTGFVNGSTTYLLPLVPQVGSNILVVPSTGYIPPNQNGRTPNGYSTGLPLILDTLILNVTYSI